MNRILKLIVDFITSNIGYSKVDIEYHAGKDLTRMCEWIKRFDKSLKSGWDEIEFQNFKDLLKRLIEIREIYQKGKSFVENYKKGHKKGFSESIFRNMKYYLKQPEKAKEIAIKHLEWIKKWKSERTYYRHKKIIRNMGISIP